MKRYLSKYANAALVIIATVVTTNACMFYLHRPEVPEELKHLQK